MSNWITITKQDLYNSGAQALVDAADTQQLGNGQAARTPSIISDVTNDIRRKVARTSVLDQTLTAIPAGLKNLAVDEILYRIKKALQQDISEADRDDAKGRERTLLRVADGKEPVDPPDNPMQEMMTQADAGVTSSASRRKATAHKLSGLI